MNSTFYFQETIKAPQIQFAKQISIGCKLCLLTLFIACQSDGKVSKDNQNIDSTRTTDEVDQDSIKLHPEEGLVFYKGEPFSGTSVAYYPNRQKAASDEYLLGKREGLSSKWFPSGIKSYESLYSNGKKDGITKSWWKNGNLRSESHFEKGIAHGEQKQWYLSGAKFKHMHLNQGQEEGMQKSWRENGKIYNNYEAKNGRIFGLKRAALCFQLDDEEVVFTKK